MEGMSVKTIKSVKLVGNQITVEKNVGKIFSSSPIVCEIRTLKGRYIEFIH